MSKKINVVSLSDVKPIENNNDESSTVPLEDELTQIKEAIKDEETREEVTKPLENVKPKRKPTLKKTKVVNEVVEPLTVPSLETKEEPAEEEEPVKQESVKEDQVDEVKDVASEKKVRTLELVKCEKCGKEMTKRTLRYDHDKTCKGAAIKREDIPVKKRVKKDVASPKQSISVALPNDIIEQEVRKD